MSEPLTAGPRPILVAVDFSDCSAAALLWAARAARAFGAPLTVLHVVHDPAAAPGYYREDSAAGPPQRLEDSARKMLDRFLERLRQNHSELPELSEAAAMLVSGIPATRILETARELEAQLIVMGSQGRTGLSHILLGSKAERVAQLSPIPVTIVKTVAADGE